MKYILSIFVLALAAISLNGLPSVNAMEADTNAKARIVVFHSDTCGSCKILAPKMKQAMSAINQDRIEKIRFDLTDEQTTQTSIALAKSKGLDDIYNSYAPKTGMVLILDNDSKEAVKITKTDGAESIAAMLASAIVIASQ